MLTFATTTAYGSWLPGDARGWISNGRFLPGDPMIESMAARAMTEKPVRFSREEQNILSTAICGAAAEFGYSIRDLSIETWHLHWIVAHKDNVDAMMGRLKTRMCQALNRGRIWTEGYCANSLKDDHAVALARSYIAAHAGCRITAGVRRK